MCLARRGTHADGCHCVDRGIGSKSSLKEVSAAIDKGRASHKSVGMDPEFDASMQRLHSHALALAVHRGQPYATTVDLDWTDEGTFRVFATHNAFMEEGDSPDEDAQQYARGIRAGQDNYLDYLTEMPDGSQRLDLYAAIHGETIF